MNRIDQFLQALEMQKRAVGVFFENKPHLFLCQPDRFPLQLRIQFMPHLPAVRSLR